MPYKIAGIDVHKKMLAVVVADIAVEGEFEFERSHYGTNPEDLRLLAEWLVEHEVEEVVMESTAQYWHFCDCRADEHHCVADEKRRVA